MVRSVSHDTFTIDRTFAASRSRLFSAFAGAQAKAKWFGPLGSNQPHPLDFRVGGKESMSGDAGAGGPRFSYDATYQDIVTNERIVYSYEMTLDGRRISVSIATLEFLDAADGSSRLILTELGAFLDGLDTNAVREGGTRAVVDALESRLPDLTGGSLRI